MYAIKAMSPFFHASCFAYSCFDWVVNATERKVKVASMFVMLIICCKIQGKLLQTTIPLKK